LRNPGVIVFTGLVLACGAGCGTLYNHEIGPCPKSRPDTFRVYGGVRKDFEEAASALHPGSDAVEQPAARVAVLPLAALLLAVDLPLSTIGDTIGLPITIGAAVRKTREDMLTEKGTPGD
jgi:uncharacterized protein YceK